MVLPLFTRQSVESLARQAGTATQYRRTPCTALREFSCVGPWQFVDLGALRESLSELEPPNERPLGWEYYANRSLGD